MSKNTRSRLGFIAFGAVFLFTSLMIYALKMDTQFVPSQLINKPAPTFVASVAQGGDFDFKNLVGKGRWIVVNFWSTTCVVCRYEAPELEGFYQDSVTRSDTAPMFISVNIQEDVPQILGYAKDYQLSFPIIADRDGKISLDYGVTGTPETFFIDPAGTVRHRVAGEVDRESILRYIDFLEHNPGLTPEDAMRGFMKIRNEEKAG